MFCYIEKVGCAMFNHLMKMLKLTSPTFKKKFEKSIAKAPRGGHYYKELQHQVKTIWFGKYTKTL